MRNYSIEKGKNADVIVWNLKKPIDIPYNFSNNSIKTVIKSGKILLVGISYKFIKNQK